MRTPQSLNYYMPPEWCEHECCWMPWRHEEPNRNSYLEVESLSHFDFEKGRQKWAEVAKAISNFEKVKMIVHPMDIKIAKMILHNSIEICEIKNDDCWARDSGATFLLNKNDDLVYHYLPKGLLNFSEDMSNPLHFLNFLGG